MTVLDFLTKTVTHSVLRTLMDTYQTTKTFHSSNATTVHFHYNRKVIQFYVL